jgi:hypothetical protein
MLLGGEGKARKIALLGGHDAAEDQVNGSAGPAVRLVELVKLLV